jgi:hypothetical protein
MTYSWEQKSLEKYGEEVTLNLIKRQKEYEEEEKDNDCNNCGKGNEGAIIEWEVGKPIVMHYGLWTDSICNYCGKHMDD